MDHHCRQFMDALVHAQPDDPSDRLRLFLEPSKLYAVRTACIGLGVMCSEAHSVGRVKGLSSDIPVEGKPGPAMPLLQFGAPFQ